MDQEIHFPSQPVRRYHRVQGQVSGHGFSRHLRRAATQDRRHAAQAATGRPTPHGGGQFRRRVRRLSRPERRGLQLARSVGHYRLPETGAGAGARRAQDRYRRRAAGGRLSGDLPRPIRRVGDLVGGHPQRAPVPERRHRCRQRGRRGRIPAYLVHRGIGLGTVHRRRAHELGGQATGAAERHRRNSPCLRRRSYQVLLQQR